MSGNQKLVLGATSGGSRISKWVGGTPTPGGTNILFDQFFPKTAWKLRNFGPGGNRVTSLTHPLDPPLATNDNPLGCGSRIFWGHTPLMAHSHCTEPGPGTMGYYILCCTVHTAPGPGTGMGTGNWSMGFGPIFPYLIWSPVLRCNQFQLLCWYIMPSLIVVCS